MVRSFRHLLEESRDYLAELCKGQLIAKFDKLDKYGLKRIVERENQLSNRAISDEIKGLYSSATFVPVMFLITAVRLPFEFFILSFTICSRCMFYMDTAFVVLL